MLRERLSPRERLRDRPKRRFVRGTSPAQAAPVETPTPAPKPAPIGHNRPPSDDELEALPLATFAEYDLSEKEIGQTRRRLYAKNKTGKFFFRTTRFGGLLAVVRFM